MQPRKTRGTRGNVSEGARVRERCMSRNVERKIREKKDRSCHARVVPSKTDSFFAQSICPFGKSAGIDAFSFLACAGAGERDFRFTRALGRARGIGIEKQGNVCFGTCNDVTRALRRLQAT